MKPRLVLKRSVPVRLFFLALAALVPAIATLADTHAGSLSTIVEQTTPSACLNRTKAEDEAETLAMRSATHHCRSAGFGWRAASVKDFGKLDCTRCGNGLYSCSYLNISLDCDKRNSKPNWKPWIIGRP